MTTKTPSTRNENHEVSVTFVDGKATTTSLDVATHFGKRHDNVMRDIKNLECPDDFHALNFEEMSRKVIVGNGAEREERFYRMTRDGFTLLCMGFTGKEAAYWKVAYINAFNNMEKILIEQPEMLAHQHLLKFALKTLELMRDRSYGLPPRPSTEQVLQNYLAVESLDQISPAQLQQALNFLQGQIIGEGAAAITLPGVAGSSQAKDLLYGLLRSAHDTELLFNSLYDSSLEKLASEAYKNHMAGKLAETSRQARDLLAYISSHAIRDPFKYKKSTH